MPDRDVDAIIETHARDRKVARWFLDTAEAFTEIGEVDLAIEWARRALDVGPWHQSQAAGGADSTRPRRAGQDRSAALPDRRPEAEQDAPARRRVESVAEIEEFIAELRAANRRRPRLRQEFDRADLP